MKIVKEINGEFYQIESNYLYKTRDDNKLSQDELVHKYEDRIVDGTLNGVTKLKSFDIDVNGKSYRGTKEAILDYVKGLLR